MTHDRGDDRPRVLAIIPTRNRADLAIAAAKSLLAVRSERIRLVLSDNSSDPAHVETLASAASTLGIEVWRPRVPMAMPLHWDWALERGWKEASSSHVTVLTDRMVVRPEAFRAVLDVVELRPAMTVSYGHDRLDDLSQPATLEEHQWTGRLLRIPRRLSARLVADANESVNMTLPRLLNAVVPWNAVSRVRDRFGDICASAVAPDFAFAFRCVAVEPATHYYDRPVLIHYAISRSNGATISRGASSTDHADFMANLASLDPTPLAPIPNLLTVHNQVVHEYEAVRTRFPDLAPVNFDRYLRALHAEVGAMEEGLAKSQAQLRLASFGRGAPGPGRTQPERVGRFLKPGHGVGVTLHQLLVDSGRAAAAWSVVRDLWGLAPPELNPVRTTTRTESALALALEPARRPHPGLAEIELDVARDYRGERITKVVVHR